MCAVILQYLQPIKSNADKQNQWLYSNSHIPHSYAVYSFIASINSFKLQFQIYIKLTQLEQQLSETKYNIVDMFISAHMPTIDLIFLEGSTHSLYHLNIDYSVHA